MHMVAIVELATPVEAEAAALAAELDSTAYEQRLNLVAGLPAVVLATPDPERARAAVRRIRGRGHGAVACALASVVPSGEMVALRRCQLATDRLVAEDPAALGAPGAAPAPGEELPFDDIAALVRATHRRRVETKTEVKERKLGLGRALASGGLLLGKTVTREETRVTTERDQVLYVFRRSGERPWLLAERSASYGWLGDKMAPSSLQNFVATVALLRARAPRAGYDERLMGPRKPLLVAASLERSRGGGSASADPTVDVLAHLLARWIMRSAGGEAPRGGDLESR